MQAGLNESSILRFWLLQVEDHEVECNPAFRLYLHTSTLPQDVPPEIAAYTTLVYLQSTREGVEIELLDR